jgi:metal-dependent hydrolase (beta-lactamase superfamily II)
VLVDPPPFTTLNLKKQGVPDNLIDYIIISHCHADHDAGVFQKILDTEKVQIITTRMIMNSFIRKYSAITDICEEEIKSLFKFRPAIIGKAHYINGGKFIFNYSLHTIPCINFEVFFEGKSLFFSGDTYYDPVNVKKMVDLGVMT